MIIGPEPEDEDFMSEALRIAARIPSRPWPNPPVGALVVRDGQIVGRGAHHGAGRPHAEIVAIEQAGALARGATLYSTLEPCNHSGRTPPCAPRVIKAGIRRVVVAICDPNPHVAGGGLSLIHEASVQVTVGVKAERSLDLIWPFAVTRAFERPFVVLKTASSLDGRFAPVASARDQSGSPFYLTGIEARREVHILRRWADVVLVGERTVAADRPRLDGRLVDGDSACPSADALPAYVDTDLSFKGEWLPRRYGVFAGRTQAAPAARARIEQDGGTVFLCDERDGHVAVESLTNKIRESGGCVVLVEGGPTLAASFLDRGLVDRWIWYTAPTVLGHGMSWPEWSSRAAVPREQQFTLTRVDRAGSDLKAVFDRVRFDDLLRQVTTERIEQLRRGGGRG